jgi:hypothetical protein
MQEVLRELIAKKRKKKNVRKVEYYCRGGEDDKPGQ